MPPVLSEFWKKLSTSEKFVMYGAGVVVIGFLVGVAAQRSAPGDLFWPILITVVYWLKYSSMKIKITWPVPVQTIVLALAAVSFVFALLGLLPLLTVISRLDGIAAAVSTAGSAVMVFFAWRGYATMAGAAPKAPTKSA